MIKTIILIFFFFLPFKVLATNTLEVVQISPLEYGDYTVQDQNKNISKAVDLATSHFFKNNKCDIQINKTLKTGSIKELYLTVKELSQNVSTGAIIGFSRSTFARIAAKAAQGTKVLGISIGASANDINTINPNFYSIAPDQKIQWQSIQKKLTENNCRVDNTLGIFQETDSYSYNFLKYFNESNYNKNISIIDNSYLSNVSATLNSANCFFMGLNVASAGNLLKLIFKSKWKGIIITTGDWAYHTEEFKKYINNKPDSIKIYVPKSWHDNKSENMTNFLTNYELLPDTISPMTYDTILLALNYLCHGRPLRDLSSDDMKILGLVRYYKGLSKSGNFISEYHFDIY